MNSDVENGSVGSRTPLVLMFITVVILVYASLFPFNFAADFDRSLFDNLGYGVWQDRVGNILGFMPLGLCIVWASERLQSIARLWVGIALSILLALLLQVAQLYLPSRDPSFMDVLNNGVGLGLGIVIAGVLPWSRMSGPHREGPPAAWLLLVLFMLLFIMTPYLPTSDVAELKTRARHLLVQRELRLEDIAGAAALWFGLFALWDGWRRSGLRVAFVVLLVALLFVWRALTPGNDLTLSNMLGALMGGVLALLLPRAWLPRTVMPVFAALILIGGLTPFEVRSTPMPPFLIPFEPLLSSPDWLIALGIAGYKSVVYGGFVMAGYRVWGRLRTAALWGMVLTGLVEAAQIVLASGTPELSDPLWLLGVAWIMSLLSPTRPRIDTTPEGGTATRSRVTG